MKKIIIPVIIAAALGIGGGIAAVTLNGTNTTIAAAETEVSNDILKSGTYYLNGDVNAEMWIEVNPDFLTLKGTDLDKSLTEVILRHHEDSEYPVTDELIGSELEDLKLLYCADKLYQLEHVGIKDIPYIIKVDRDNKITDREELLNTNAGLAFNDQTNMISLAVGDFTLVE